MKLTQYTPRLSGLPNLLEIEIQNFILLCYILNVPPEDLLGTLKYKEMCYAYGCIYLSDIPVADKVKNASFVANFIRLWRLWIDATPGLTVGKNYISRECSIDTILSCHCAVLILRHSRDFSPDLDIELGLTGTDCVVFLLREWIFCPQ